MASCSRGYATDHFKVFVENNFLCSICAEVLKDPVQCQNQHHFCKVCIKKHLETNAKSCPICVQDLEEKTLAEPPRILTDYLNGLLISCDHSERGCTEAVPVSQLKAHVRECKYRPVVCPNEKCEQTINQEDLTEHLNNACEYRLMDCPDCEDDMIYKKFSNHACVLSKDLNKLKVEWAEVKNVLGEICNSQKEILKSEKKLARKQNTAETPLPNVTATVVVIGGQNKNAMDSVEVLYSGSKVWKVLQLMQEPRGSTASLLHRNDVIVSERRCNECISDAIEQLSLVKKPLTWIPFPVKLPFTCCGHNSDVINDCLYLVRGHGGDFTNLSKQFTVSYPIHHIP